MHLSVIIPAYNEEIRLGKTLQEVFDYLKKQEYDSEILVVDDGSTDKTAEIALALEKNIKNLHVLKIAHAGKGSAVREGMLKAKGDFRVFMDADNSTSIDQIERMWPEFEKGYEVVIGSRDMKGAVISIPQPWWRRRLGDVFNLIVQVVSGLWGIWDTQCGFKGFTERAAEDIFSRTIIDGWAFDVEVLMLASKRRHALKEIPVVWANAPNSKVNLKSMMFMFFEVLASRINMFAGNYNA